MAPTKSTRAIATKQTALTAQLPMITKVLTRRQIQQLQQNHDQNKETLLNQTRGKRKAEHSPIKNDKIKRSALGNLTNNVKMPIVSNAQHSEEDAKHQPLAKKKDINFGHFVGHCHVLKDSAAPTAGGDAAALKRPQHKVTTRASTRTSTAATTTVNTNNAKNQDEQINKLMIVAMTAVADRKKNEEAGVAPPPPQQPPAPMAVPKHMPHKPVRRISNEFNKTEESLYMSALEDVSTCESMRLSGNFEAKRRSAQLLQQKQGLGQEEQSKCVARAQSIPSDVDDFDKANWNDPFQVSHYAMDIFEYLREREKDFVIGDYMEQQVNISKFMRSLLVDWMVEVQETFELNHETLYLAVKLVDLYLCKVIIQKEKLQLLGAAALFIACKYDERTPPLIEDFLYICDGAYQHDELVKMEMHTLRTIDYDLSIPLSYRFLRRYARCAKVSMPTLTLARYILELSLMDYAIIGLSDSKLASAALFIALRLHNHATPWTPTLEYYSGYKLSDFVEIIPILNAGLHRKPKGAIKTIRSKYSHVVFHEAAKVPLFTTAQLLENNIDLNGSIQLN